MARLRDGDRSPKSYSRTRLRLGPWGFTFDSLTVHFCALVLSLWWRHHYWCSCGMGGKSLPTHGLLLRGAALQQQPVDGIADSHSKPPLVEHLILQHGCGLLGKVQRALPNHIWWRRYISPSAEHGMPPCDVRWPRWYGWKSTIKLGSTNMEDVRCRFGAQTASFTPILEHGSSNCNQIRSHQTLLLHKIGEDTAQMLASFIPCQLVQAHACGQSKSEEACCQLNTIPELRAICISNR